jgi:hypothetical protein
MTAPHQNRWWLFLGLFFTTLATLMVEVLDTRLLSVLTWYHLSFLAVSLAMLGMSAGAVFVFVGGARFDAARVVSVLPRVASAFAVALAASHVANLLIPFHTADGRLAHVGFLVATMVALTCPFVLSGIVVTLALTRTAASIGMLYGADLIGAAMGCLAVVWLLEVTDISSTAFAAAAAAALGAWAFGRHAQARQRSAAIAVVVLIAAALLNAASGGPVGIVQAKGRSTRSADYPVELMAWNAYSNVMVRAPFQGPPSLWGPAADAPKGPVTAAQAAIDGGAGTVLTQWDGRPESLDWVQYDVTSLPYRLRQGTVAVIGVGGGRDILTAIWAGNRSITGIEINEIFLRALRGQYRGFTRIADHPGVSLVNDEARSFLTRTDRRFDVLQMSLIDTWAATGAGAFTLTENGLYTRQAWQVFLGALTPTGAFSVSRWFDPAAVSETTRLLALGVAALLDRGIAVPRAHLILVTRERIATLMVSPSAFTEQDRVRLQSIADARGFSIRVSPWHDPSDRMLGQIANARAMDDLHRAADDPLLDYTPPTDERPFFFNMLKPGAAFRYAGFASPGVVGGNLRATRTLLAVAALAGLLVLTIIIWPLLSSGRPPLPPALFVATTLYFGLIGLAFMLVQIAFLQRFSVYLGHPTYTFAVILFLMILSAGLGSLASERLDLQGSRRLLAFPLGIALLVLLEAASLQSAIDLTIGWELPGRIAIVAGYVAPLAFALGYCFPIGMRLIAGRSDHVAAWMWGINGACGVIASILAVMISMHLGIHANLLIASGLYTLLAWPMYRLARARNSPLAGLQGRPPSESCTDAHQ